MTTYQTPTVLRIIQQGNPGAVTYATLAAFGGGALLGGQRSEVGAQAFTQAKVNQNRALNVVDDFGALGDGLSHQLSTVTSCSGQNTTGWSLAQWQTIYPCATALTNDLESCAFQTAINAAITNNMTLEVPPTASYYQIAGNLTMPHGLHVRGLSSGPADQYYGSQAGMARLVFTGTGIGINIPVTTVAATALVVGKVYATDTPGTTNWVTCGAANNSAGTVFTCTTIGTGTGTADLCDAPYGVTLENLVIQGNPGMYAGVKVAGTTNCGMAFFNLLHSFIYGFTTGYGLIVAYCTSNNIERSVIETCGVACQLNNAMATHISGCNLEQSLVGLDVKSCNAVKVTGSRIQGNSYARQTLQGLAMPSDFQIWGGWGNPYRYTLAQYAGTGVRNLNSSITLDGCYMESNTWGVLNELAGITNVIGGYVEIDNTYPTTPNPANGKYGDCGFMDIGNGSVSVKGTICMGNAQGSAFTGLFNFNGALYGAPLDISVIPQGFLTTAQMFTGTGAPSNVGRLEFFEVAKYRMLSGRAHVFQTGNDMQLTSVTTTGSPQSIDISANANANKLWVVVSGGGAGLVTFNWLDAETLVEGTEITVTIISSGSNSIAFGAAFRTDAASYAMTNGKTMTFTFDYINGAWRSRYVPVQIAQ